MKTIGLLGGMSWESTLEYYRLLNRLVRERLGALHSARCIIYSVDFQPIAEHQEANRWEPIRAALVEHAQALEKCGAEVLLLCANTMHKLADHIQARVGIPLLHIAEETAKEIARSGFKTAGLLGTRYTMEEGFFKERLSRHGIEMLIPEKTQRDEVHRIIFAELVQGVIDGESAERCRRIIARLVERGAEGIVLGCTELPMLIKAQDSPVPLFDTLEIHCRAATAYACAAGGAP